MWLQLSACALAFVLLVRVFRKRISAYLLARFVQLANTKLKTHKTQWLSSLNDRSRSAGRHKIKLLEIGGGAGANFAFVHSPVDWTVLEPNPFSQQYFRKNVEQCGGEHKINPLVVGFGEDMSCFSDSSFDAVLCTMVLCEVADAKAVLSEVKRVLKPGGRFYFLEHVIAPAGSFKRLVQHALTESGVWPFLDGCRLNLDTGATIRRAGFADVDITNFVMPVEHHYALYPCSAQIFGHATK